MSSNKSRTVSRVLVREKGLGEVCVWVHTRACMHVHTHMHTHRVCILYTQICIFVYIHIYI